MADKTPAQESSLYGGKVKIKFFPDSHIYMVNGVRKTGVTTLIGIIDKSNTLVSWATELAADYMLELMGKGEKITDAHILRAQDLHRERKQEAADTGTKIHDWCEQYIKAKLKIKGYSVPEMPEDQAVQIGVSAFMDWETEHKVKFISSERVVYSRKHDYIGKMDIEAKIDGELCLVDLKSSNGLYNTVRLQTAAYVKADEEESKKKYAGRWAIRLSKETEKEYMARMAKKQAKDVLKGKEPRQITPYQVFEAKYLDEKKGDMANDFDGFLSAVNLYRWNKDTDFWTNK